MDSIEIWLLAISLAMDCFTVSVTSGIILHKIKWNILLKMAFFFGLFQAVMPFLGWLGISFFSASIKAYDHWIAFGLLSYIGFHMVREHFDKDKSCTFDPTRLKVILMLAVATSIDAFAIGISFGVTGFDTLSSLFFPLIAIGVTSFVLSIAGGLIGACFGRKYHFYSELFGGVILIGIGIKILVVHLVNHI